MEKKNMVLLTVIAVATLLVAVVGATFAYFTATVNTTGEETSTQVTTTKLATVTYKTGDTVTKSDWCPGSYVANTFDIAADAGNTGAVNVRIFTEGSTSTFTTGNLKWELYEADSEEELPEVTEGTCAFADGGEDVLNGQKYSASGSINKKSLEPKKSGVLKQEGITELDYSVSIPQSDHKYYSLVVYLEDTGKEQDADQNKTAKMKINVEYVKSVS